MTSLVPTANSYKRSLWGTAEENQEFSYPMTALRSASSTDWKAHCTSSQETSIAVSIQGSAPLPLSKYTGGRWTPLEKEAALAKTSFKTDFESRIQEDQFL
jgi:hypothetical protein